MQPLYALSRLTNTLIKLSDGWGMSGELTSARAWRLRDKHPKLLKFIDGLFWFDPNHCQECYAIEKQRKQQPKEYQS